MKKSGFATRAIHAGHEGFIPDTMSVPIYQTVAYPFADALEAAEIFSGKRPGFTYGRWDNPTVKVFEDRMAAIEGTEAAIATASGMSAIFLLLHQLVKAGEEIVSSNRVYGGTFSLFSAGAERMGIKTNWVTTPEKREAWAKAITPKTKLLFVESPSNPSLFIADIRELADLAKSKGLPLVADNTITTPALQRPVDLGADVVVHSTTKYICGNATSLGGIICGSRKLVEDGIRGSSMRYLGPAMAPFNAWLSTLGLEHLELRMARHSSNAMTLATYLEAHPAVQSVNYPGLASNPYHQRAKAQMKSCSSLMSFIIKGTYDDAVKIIDSLELWVHATHLGASKTIVTHPASTTHSAMGPTEMAKAGISPTMIRVCVGLEDPDDIVADIDQALKKVSRKPTARGKR